MRLDQTPRPSSSAPVAAPHSPAQRRPLHILLAEDNVVNQIVATRMLEKNGHSVVRASNGEEALALFSGETFDAILMDVQMPVMDGLMATRRIRERETATKLHVPVIALTARAMQEDESICIDAGMDAYLSKPLEPGALLRTLDELTASQEGAAATKK